MGLLSNIFGASKQQKFDQALSLTTQALQPQLTKAREEFSSQENWEAALMKIGVLGYLVGFIGAVAQFCGYHAHQVTPLTAEILRSLLGDPLGDKMRMRITQIDDHTPMIEWFKMELQSGIHDAKRFLNDGYVANRNLWAMLKGSSETEE